MSVSTRRIVLEALPGEAGDERARIDADTELSIERTPEGGVTVRQQTTGTANFEKVIESELTPAEAAALRDRLADLLAE